jgi:aminobenzoyl-glutamate utilization protein B
MIRSLRVAILATAWLLLVFCATPQVPLGAQQPTPSAEALKKEALAQVNSFQALTQQMVDEIYSYSELGFQEFETSRYVSGILEQHYYDPSRYKSYLEQLGISYPTVKQP